MNNLIIRKAVENDLASIIDFNKKMASETENIELDHDTISSGVKRLFKNPQYGFYIVAEIEKKICACLMITTEWSDWRDGLFCWVQSVYVLPEYRRRGIYSRMYDFVKNLSYDNPDVRGFRLYVEKDNIKAQQTYEKNKMVLTHYKMYEEITKK